MARPAAPLKKAFRDGIVLRVNDTARVDISLEVGSVDQQVTVTTAAPEINTSTAELGRTVQSREIENLPLVERNVYTLLDLTPGVQSNNTGIATASATTSNLSLGFPEQRTLINGGTDGGTGSVNYYLDGGVNMTNLRNTGNILPNPDAIQEFRVQTNAYNAEYGRFANGIINVLTKSGTNAFHGSLYEFVRNDAFNANEWGSRLAKPPYRRNQFGGTIGGPIIHDRTFFFFSYAGLRQITNTFLAGARVPTALERIGNGRIRPVGVNQRRLHQSQRDDFPGLPAAAGDRDGRARRIVGRIRFHCGQSIQLGRIPCKGGSSAQRGPPIDLFLFHDCR